MVFNPFVALILMIFACASAHADMRVSALLMLLSLQKIVLQPWVLALYSKILLVPPAPPLASFGSGLEFLSKL